MQVTTPPTKEPTVASAARRTQIVRATVAVIAAEGLARASFVRIAAEADLSSTRLISYHFADKDELIAAVVDHVLAGIGAYVGDRIEAAESATSPGDATAILRAYIEGSVGFIDTHRAQMQALLQIVLGGGLPAEHDLVAQQEGQRTSGPLEGLLRHGQSTGQFRSFDVTAVGGAIQRAIEGLPFLLSAQPDLDCDTYAAELVELYLRGVRADLA